MNENYFIINEIETGDYSKKLIHELNVSLKNMPSIQYGNLQNFDIMILGILNRAIENCRAIEACFLVKAYSTCGYILRSHIDCLMHLYSLNISVSHDNTAKKILKGKDLKDIKDDQGNLMRDGYLVKRFSQDFIDIDHIYKVTNKYAHFSSSQIFGSTLKLNDNKASEVFLDFSINGITTTDMHAETTMVLFQRINEGISSLLDAYSGELSSIQKS